MNLTDFEKNVIFFNIFIVLAQYSYNNFCFLCRVQSMINLAVQGTIVFVPFLDIWT